ncbi:programmed cell death 1 ligand 1-like [Pelodytes ibericus]
MAQSLFILVAFLLASEFSQANLDVDIAPSPVVVKVGEKVQLKCILNLGKEKVNLQDLVVQWFTRGVQVAEFDKNITIDKPGLSMSEKALEKGDATLTIDSAKEDNSGNYRCYITYGQGFRFKQIVLKVEDPNKPKEEDESASDCADFLSAKIDKVIGWFGKLDAKIEELLRETKKHQSPSQKSHAK